MVDKRLGECGKYEYLVMYKNFPRTCASWVSAKEIPKKKLIEEFELTRDQLVKEQKHLAAWYTFDEHFVVRWENKPYFVVPYESGQLNNFCIVGLDTTKTKLKCTGVHNPGQATHQVHVKLVQAEMRKLGLQIADLVSLTTTSSAEKVEKVRPISQQQISLQTSTEVMVARNKLVHGTQALPTCFKPTSHPEVCQCETVTETGEKVQVTHYKSEAEVMNIQPTLWLSFGAPVTDKSIFVWKCKNNNPSCNIYYDGREDAIFNYSNTTLVSHVVLFEFLFGLVTG